MTYRELQELLADFTQDQLDNDVTIFNGSIEEYFPVTALGATGETDVLDAGHAFLTIYG